MFLSPQLIASNVEHGAGHTAENIKSTNFSSPDGKPCVQQCREQPDSLTFTYVKPGSEGSNQMQKLLKFFDNAKAKKRH